MDQGRIGVINCSDAAPGWRWIADLCDAPIDWRFVSTQRSPLAARLPGPHLGRVRAGLQVRRLAGMADLIVSHGPYTSYYVERLGQQRTHTPHLAMAFNFTDIPGGARAQAMRRTFASVDRFAVYSRAERELYAERFDVPIERFHFVRWGVTPPITAPLPRTIPEPYVIAIGGEARDFATLCAAARRLPALGFVLVVRPHSLNGIHVPPNVTVHVNLPWAETWSLMWWAQAALVPLRSRETPNGHVSIVGAMHLGKAQVATDSIGVSDYVADGETALLTPAGDDTVFAAAIERLIDEPALAARLGENARIFARDHCSEASTVQFFAEQLHALLDR